MKFRKELGFSTSVERSELMKKIHSNNTKPEIILRKALWSQGIRYRLNVKKVTGTPDILISKHKIAIFVDGEFWHGFNWGQKKLRLKSNRDFWIPKIERNIKRDEEVNNKLLLDGYKVFRFWEHQIYNDAAGCVAGILSFISEKRSTSLL